MYYEISMSVKTIIRYEWINPLPDDKILGLSKQKAFADDKLNVTQHIKVVFHRIELRTFYYRKYRPLAQNTCHAYNYLLIMPWSYLYVVVNQNNKNSLNTFDWSS